MSATVSEAMQEVVVNGEGQHSIWPMNKAASERWMEQVRPFSGN